VHFEKRNDPTPEYYDVTFWVTRGNRKICRWIGHKFTVFDIYGDRLYYALFDPRQHSGKIVAVNLLSGTKLWESDLINPSIFAGSFYENRIILEAHKDRVVIFGRDTAGDYIEIKDSKSGDTIGQKVVKKNFGGT
jgi:outer membrane protein assembly factor BamB